jgi:hypothetical protein
LIAAPIAAALATGCVKPYKPGIQLLLVRIGASLWFLYSLLRINNLKARIDEFSIGRLHTHHNWYYVWVVYV